jgi:hypothetical protein
MPNAPEPEPGEEATQGYAQVPHDDETETVAINKPDSGGDPRPDPDPEGQKRERRFTAPGFDAKETAVIRTPAEPETEVFASPPTAAPPAPVPPASPPPQEGETTQLGALPKAAVPQAIPPRLGAPLRTSRRFNWGWVLALIVVVLALAAIAILGTVLLTRHKNVKVSEEERVRDTIHQYDIALQRGDLKALRTITCGSVRDGYVDYDEHAWQESYQSISAAKQYPVIASVDQVVVNGQHAEANVTSFMAYDPSVRSTRSLDLQYRDDQWKVCQSTSG